MARLIREPGFVSGLRGAGTAAAVVDLIRTTERATFGDIS
jgi:hypothetical protein